MSGRFIRAAYRILDQELRPLTPKQIVQLAIDKGLLSTVGKTPASTMRARLSDEIRSRGTDSYFVRTGANRFGLRAWNFSEYHARPFTKSLPDEITVCIPGSTAGAEELNGVGFTADAADVMRLCRDRDILTFVGRQEAEKTNELRQLIVYVWLETDDGLVLSYTRGKYSSAHRTLLLGKRSIGFGGHVLMQDAESLFGVNDGGIEQAGLREIGEELGEAAPRSLNLAGVIWDDTSFEGQKHIGFVMRGELGSSTRLPRRSSELSINELRLLSRAELWESFHTMEFWSQLLIRQFASDSRPSNISTIVPRKRPRNVSRIALVGEIANGKSHLGQALSSKLGYRVISVSAVLRALLGVGEVSESSRLEFQSKALQFIDTAEGPDRLASAVADEARKYGQEPIIFDGIRQRSTLAALREHVLDIIVIYVDCPRDQAFRNYGSRIPNVTARQFSAVREHPVEADLPLFRFESDAIFNNADTFENSVEELTLWLTSER